MFIAHMVVIIRTERMYGVDKYTLGRNKWDSHVTSEVRWDFDDNRKYE